jgi:hypothetical protein
MLNLAIQLFIVATVTNSVSATVALGLAAKQYSPLFITNGVRIEAVDNNLISMNNRATAQQTGNTDRERLKLLARTEAPPDNPKGVPQIILTLRNESQSLIYIVETGKPRDFKLEIMDRFGKIVSPRGKRLPGLVVNEGKHSLDAVNPGQEISYTINLGDLYSLSPGRYTLKAKRSIFLDDKRTTVEIISAPVRFVF